MSQLQSRRRKHWTQTPIGRRIQHNKMVKYWRERKALPQGESSIHDAEIVNENRLKKAFKDTLPLDDHGKDALVAILDNVWAGMSVEEKIALLDPRGPSNPEGL